MFDARPDAFGPYRVVDEIRAGRSGRVYRAQEPATGAFVIVKIFDLELTSLQAGALAGALERLCRAPLDHPSIVAPVAAGLEADRPWLAEPQVDGDALDAVMRSGEPVADVLLRITQLAGALDFAAAAGIRHGALGPRDIIISGDRTLVTCLGVQQGLAQAGVAAPMRDDVQVLAAIAGEWLAGVQSERVRTVLEAAASGAHTGSALEFAAALQNAAADPDPAISDPHPAVRDLEPTVPIVVDADLRVAGPEPRFADAELRLPDRGAPLAERAERMADRDARIAERAERIGERTEPTVDRRDRMVDSDARWLPMAAMLAIGLLGGFAAGFVVGQRDATPAPHAAERAVRRPAPDPEAPAPTAGRESTEADLPTAVEEPELRIPSAPAAGNQQQGTRNPEPGTNNRAPGTGTPEPAQLVVDSRPRGARVFVDGRLVGQTPLTLPRVTPGEHAVRIDLLGYQRWMTRVTVAPGDRTRVAASLER